MRRVVVSLVAGLLAMLAGGQAHAAAGLSAKTLTWGVIGLDSNDVTVGPALFPVGARVCNTGTSAATSLTARFVWDSANPYLAVKDRTLWNLGTLGAGACKDAYFTVAVQRTTAAYFAKRSFHIAFGADGLATRTPTRELYVEKLVSQNRNAVLGISGPATMTLGKSYVVVVDATTAPQGYEQVEAFLSLPTSLIRVDRVTMTATAGPSPVSQPYIDACGWQSDPASPGYLTCSGTAKAGGTMRVTYRVTVVGLGTGTATTLVYDRSGSSYHYNTDYGRASNLYSFRTVAPDLALAKSHTGTFTEGGTGTFRLTVTNTGTGATTDPITLVDRLPAGMVYVSASGGGFSCTASSGTVRCVRTSPLQPGASAVVTVVVRTTSSGTLTNSAVVSTPNDPRVANNSDTDTVTVLAAPTTSGPRAVTATTPAARRPATAVRPGAATAPLPVGAEARSQGALPDTGADVDVFARRGALLVLLGAALVVASFVRRPARPSSRPRQ